MRKAGNRTIIISFLLVMLTFCSLGAGAKEVSEKKMPSQKVYIGKEIQLKTGVSSKTSWKSSDQSIVAVRSDGSAKAQKAGKATITAKAGNRQWKWVVKVKPYSLTQMKAIVNRYFNTHKEWKGNYVASDISPYKKNGKYYYIIRTKNFSNAANVLVGRLSVNRKTGKGVLECSYPYTGTYKFNFL